MHQFHQSKFLHGIKFIYSFPRLCIIDVQRRIPIVRYPKALRERTAISGEAPKMQCDLKEHHECLLSTHEFRLRLAVEVNKVVLL